MIAGTLPSRPSVREHQARTGVSTTLLLGPPRSGTTLLGRLLGGLDGVLSCSEPFMSRAVLPSWALDRQFREFQKNAALRRRRPPFHCDDDGFLGFLHRQATQNGFRHLVIKETYRERGMKPVWHNAALLSALLARADAAVGLIRDPADLAASSIGLCGWNLGLTGRLVRIRWPQLSAFRTATDVVRWAADNWVRYLNWARRHGVPVFRYEDLVRRPQVELRKICERCGLPAGDDMLEPLKARPAFGGIGDPGLMAQRTRGVDAKSIGKGRMLNDVQRGIVREICGRAAKDFGYDLG